MASIVAQALITVAVVVIAFALGLAGLGFLCAGLYSVLLGLWSPPLAAFATGATLLVLALILAAVALGTARRRPSGTGGGDAKAASAEEIGSMLGQAAGSVIRDNAPRATVLALVAGFAVGISPGLRRILGRALSQTFSKGTQ